MNNPPLTTIVQPLHEMGEKAMDRILGMLKTGERGDNIILPHRVVERDTVKLLE